MFFALLNDERDVPLSSVVHHQDALRRIIAVMMVWVGMPLSASLYGRIRSVLLPAESALRRLIVIAAQGTALPRAKRDLPDFGAFKKSSATPAFPLFDPRLAFDRRPSPKGLRISFIGDARDIPVKPVISSAALRARLQRLNDALESLPRQAKRLARWRARHPRSLKRPMRPGRAPGFRRRPLHAVDYLLKRLQSLALDVMAADTS